jgi:hypothetical protein
MRNTMQVKDKARVYIAMAACHESRGELRKSVESCIAGLNLYGLDLSITPSNTYVEKLKNEIMELQRMKAPSTFPHLSLFIFLLSVLSCHILILFFTHSQQQ